MTLYGTSLLMATVVLFLTATIFWLYSTVLGKYATIPGPKGHIIFGNTLDFGSWTQLRTWSRQYGELFHVRLGTEHLIYVNSREAVRELYEKQSAKTSCKGPLLGGAEIVHRQRLAVMPYGSIWRSRRSIIHKLLTPQMALTYSPSHEFEVKQLLGDLLDRNGDEQRWFKHVDRYNTSVILTSVYDIRAASENDPLVEAIRQVMQDFSTTTEPGAFITDIIPFFAALPKALQWWRPRALSYYHRQQKLWMGLLQNLQHKTGHGEGPHCFAKDFIEQHSQIGDFSEEEIAFLAGTMIEAGSDTTSGALKTAILYLAANPAVQQQAHAEIDFNFDDDHPPTLRDKDTLPFITALIKEVFRIRPLTRLGTPHYTTAETTYKIHTIPACTFLVLNQSALHFDPLYFPNPETFDPARYLPSSSSSSPSTVRHEIPHPDHYNFGAGRRICPGTHLAQNSLFTVLARLLWAFEILPPLDGEGKMMVMDVGDEAFEAGANHMPRVFRVRFEARGRKKADVVRREWERAVGEGYEIRGLRVGEGGVGGFE